MLMTLGLEELLDLSEFLEDFVEDFRGFHRRSERGFMQVGHAR